LRRCAAVCLQPFSSTWNNFANKNNVEYEQKHFQGVVLPQAQRAEKERNDSRDVPHHGERKGITVQQQVGRGRKDVERGAGQTDRPQPRGTGGQPYAGQDTAWHQQGVSGGVRHRRICHCGKGAQRLLRSGTEPQDPACRVQAAQRGLCETGGQDEERAQLLEIPRGI